MGACEDNCCRNTTWSITVDPETYKKYANLGGELGEHILSCIEETGEGAYKFKEFDHGHCPLLTDEGLCLIHRDLGEGYLCHTCTTYPRIWSPFNGYAEHWLSLSCPDVIRHVLYKKKKITFIEFPMSPCSFPDPNVSFPAEKFQIRQFLVEIAQYRKFSLKEKLIFSGLFMRSLSKITVDDNYSKSIADAISAYRSSMRTAGLLEKLLSDLGAIHIDNRSQILITLADVAANCALPPKKIPEGIKNTEYYKLMTEFHNDAVEKRLDNYLADAFDRLIVPYVNANRYVFENYLAYSLVSTKFLADTDDFAKAYAGFAGEFLAMFAYTAGLFHANETLNDDEMIIGMYLYHRKISHSVAVRKALADAFSDNLLPLLFCALGGIN